MSEQQGYQPRGSISSTNYQNRYYQHHLYASSAQKAASSVTIAIPSAERAAKLEAIIGYKWKSKDLMTKAATRCVEQSNNIPFPDDTVITVEHSAPEAILLNRLMLIGHRVFEVEIWRSTYERQGLESLLRPFPHHVLDQLVLPSNKVIAAAVLLDGGMEAVEKVMPHFYSKSKDENSNDSTDNDEPVIKIEHCEEDNDRRADEPNGGVSLE